MTYRSDRQIAEALLPVTLLHTVVHDGADLDDTLIKQVLTWLTEAGTEVCAGLTPQKATAIMRRVDRIHNHLIDPFKKAEAPLAKVGLTVYYLLERLRDCGYFRLEDGTSLDKAIAAILDEGGTLAQLANVEAADKSAQKQARKLLDALKTDGLYREAIWQ